MTHRYWIEIRGGIHMDTVLKAKMINFYKRLLTHEKSVGRLTAHTIRNKRSTITGSNIATLQRESRALWIINNTETLENIRTDCYKRTRRYTSIEPDNMYRIPLMNELIMIRDRELYIDDDHFENDDILMTINSLATH